MYIELQDPASAVPLLCGLIGIDAVGGNLHGLKAQASSWPLCGVLYFVIDDSPAVTLLPLALPCLRCNLYISLVFVSSVCSVQAK